VKIFSFLFLLSFCNAQAAEKPSIIVGSKIFAESYILAEIFSQIIDETGEAKAIRKFGLGQTGIAFQALNEKKIDLYPEYTGTIAESILKDHVAKTIPELRAQLEPLGLTISDSLGFKDTYALAVRRDDAQEMSLSKISDLKSHTDIRAALSHEFMERSDGYPKLKAIYGFHLANLHGIAHGLSYQAIERDEISLTDIYSTDAMVQKLNLVVLEDDLSVFPDYSAIIFAQSSLPTRFPKTWKKLLALQDSISSSEMTHLNAMAELEKKTFAEVAAFFLKSKTQHQRASLWSTVWKLTKQHVALVGISLIAAVLVGVPLGIISAKYKFLGQIILSSSGVIQTIPSLALLCFLIPIFGIGNTPALVALFLYGLLPIVRGTYVGLTSLDSRLREVSKALGLSYLQRILRVEIPMASPSIMSGIRTSATINVGTTTLAALIGAGGYGVPIVTGLALNDINTILEGAIPAAIMALVVHWLFDLAEIFIVPKGIR
jgi:osmoprotectant transport system permease protein